MTHHPISGIPCRLHVILARKSPVAVIFRRGPSKWTQLIRWDTANDSFEYGQWFRGRIYEQRSDLSPDGRYLIYFAAKIDQRTLADADVGYAWTAISHPPYLTALCLWPKGDCWDGGGLFLSDRQIWLNHPPDRTTTLSDRPAPKWLRVLHNSGRLGEDEPIATERMIRDGWRHVRRWRGQLLQGGVRPLFERARAESKPFDPVLSYTDHEVEKGPGYITERPDRFEKPQPGDGGRVLVMRIAIWGLRGRVTYTLRDAEFLEHRLVGATWADWDQSGRLVYVSNGRLYAVHPSEISADRSTTIANFNDLTPVSMVAPSWATRW